MIDYLRFATDQEVRAENVGGAVLMEDSAGGRAPYSFKRYVLENGGELLVKHFPYSDQTRNMKRYMVDINPKYFPSWADFRMFLYLLLSKNDLEEPIIRRLDLALDVEYPLSYFRENLRIKRKRSCDYYVTSSNSIVLGKKPERITVYDKAKESKLPKGTVLVRIEIQYESEKLPIKHLTEIEDLLWYNPYHHFIIGESVINWSEVKTPKDEITVRALRDYIREYGYHDARKMLDKSGRFKSKFGRFLINPTAIPPLKEMFQKNLDEWLDAAVDEPIDGDSEIDLEEFERWLDEQEEDFLASGKN